MKKGLLVTALVLGLSVAGASAADLTMSLVATSVQCGGQVAAGATVDYEIHGLLSDTNDNEGLALFGVTMAVTGPSAVDLETATTVYPGSGMSSFVNPDGLNNPAGFGGTPIAGELVQIGGGQNTINNDAGNAPFPIGDVVTGIGHTEVVLGYGTLTMPAVEGTYTIVLKDGFANQIKAGEAGPVYAVEAIGNITLHSCEIVVGQPTEAIPIGATSMMVYDGSCTDPGLDLFNSIEFRAPGVTQLNVEMNQAMSDNPSASVACVNNVYGGTATAVADGSAFVVVTFSEALPDQDCCTITVGVGSFNVTVLKGDTNQDGGVTTSDAALIKPHYQEDFSTASMFDYNADCLITTSDTSLIKARFQNAAPACP